MKIYFTTGEKPSQEVLDVIHSIDSRHWEKEVKAWSIDDSEKDKLPLDKMPNVTFYDTKEEIPALTQTETQTAEQKPVQGEENTQKSEKEQKPLPPEIKEALDFKNGNSKDISMKAFYAYLHHQTSFLASTKFKGDAFAIEKMVNQDEIFQRPFENTSCKSLATKLPYIMKSMKIVAKDRHLTNLGINKSIDEKNLDKDVAVKRFKKSSFMLHQELDNELAKTFPEKFMKEVAQKTVENKEKNTQVTKQVQSQGAEIAQDFIAGRTTNLTVGAVKSHVMTLTGQLIGDAAVNKDTLGDILDQDKILNADLSKTDIAEMAVAMPNIKAHVYETILQGKERVSEVEKSFEAHEINETEMQKQISAIKHTARITSSGAIPNTNLLDNEKALNNKSKRGYETMMQPKDLLYIASTREAKEEHDVIKSVEGYSYNGLNNYWTVPKKNIKGIAAFKNMKVYASRADLQNDKQINSATLGKLIGSSLQKKEVHEQKEDLSHSL